MLFICWIFAESSSIQSLYECLSSFLRPAALFRMWPA